MKRDYQVSIRAKCGHVVLNSFKFKPQSQEIREIRAIQKNKLCPRCENVALMKVEK